MSARALDCAPGQDWIAIVGKNGTNDFATAFVARPVLYASALNAPCIAAFFAATSAMYDTISFTHETRDGLKTCLEWEGKVFGEDVAGTTILSDAGLSESVQLYHRPLHTENLRTAFDGAEYLAALAVMSTTCGLPHRLDAVRWPAPVRLGNGGIPWTMREMTDQKMIVFETSSHHRLNSAQRLVRILPGNQALFDSIENLRRQRAGCTLTASPATYVSNWHRAASPRCHADGLHRRQERTVSKRPTALFRYAPKIIC